MSWLSIKKLLKGAGIAIAGAGLTYVGQLVAGGSLGSLGELTVAAAVGVGINFVRKLIFPDAQ